MPPFLISYVGADEGFLAVSELLGKQVVVEHVPATPDAVALALKTSDAFLDASMKVRLTDVMIESAARLKIIACATTGSDHIDRATLDRRSIPVRTLKEDAELLRNITPAAELSWALLMACARGLPAAIASVRDGHWTREDFPGVMLNGKTLGLVGCGRIGGWMSRYGQAFGMSVIACDPYQKNMPDGVAVASPEEIFRRSDFISIHVHLSDETRNLVSRSLLEQCKPGMVLINTSRGAVVDEDALLDGLSCGRVGGCGLDVLDGEPDIAEHPLVKYARLHDNVLITPHCGGYSPDAVRVVCAHSAKKIADVLGLQL